MSGSLKFAFLIISAIYLVNQTSSYVISINNNDHQNYEIPKQTDKEDSQSDPRFIGSLVDSYMKFAQRFDASNPFKKFQKFGVNRFLTTNAASWNRAFNTVLYRANSYYSAAYSALSNVFSALPDNTRERIFENIVHNGVPYVMNATGWFDSSAVEWVVDTGNKVLETYKKERQVERRNAATPITTEGSDKISANLPRRISYR